MTKEERKLLLMDLCGRLPHEVMANIQLVENDNRIYKVDVHWLKDFIENNVVIKPYLRPLNTITKSEIADAIKYICDTDNAVSKCITLYNN